MDLGGVTMMMQEPITWEMVKLFFTADLRVYIFMMATLLGMLTNFLKTVKLQQKVTLADYTKKYVWNSIASIVGATIGWAYLYEQDTQTLLAYFGVGYMSDSILNKATTLVSSIAPKDTGMAQQAGGDSNG